VFSRRLHGSPIHTRSAERPLDALVTLEFYSARRGPLHEPRRDCAQVSDERLGVLTRGLRGATLQGNGEFR
jgi:hypothetical protein